MDKTVLANPGRRASKPGPNVEGTRQMATKSICQHCFDCLPNYTDYFCDKVGNRRCSQCVLAKKCCPPMPAEFEAQVQGLLAMQEAYQASTAPLAKKAYKIYAHSLERLYYDESDCEDESGAESPITAAEKRAAVETEKVEALNRVESNMVELKKRAKADFRLGQSLDANLKILATGLPAAIREIAAAIAKKPVDNTLIASPSAPTPTAPHATGSVNTYSGGLGSETNKVDRLCGIKYWIKSYN
ncbi:hypothetical protein FQN49_005139 [Arthroderma sp. PD_2]|nr:hypothetical protein FQN49_005139 [Arthroderma sp. PD_2]